MPLPTPLPSHVPESVRAHLKADVGRRHHGCSGADVFHIEGESGPVFLKVFFAAEGRDCPLCDERDRIGWLVSRTDPDIDPNVPSILAFEQRRVEAGKAGLVAGTWSYLLTTAVPGRPLHEAMAETPIRVGRLMGNALRWLHGRPTDGLAKQSPDDLIATAEKRVANGSVNSSNLRVGGDPKAAAKLLAKLQKRVPTDADYVVSHADYCLPNVLADLGDRTGLIDLGELCVADRHLDLATANRSLRFNGGREDVIRVFGNWYGPDTVDLDRLDFYAGLAELL